jgi:hypothetical protein
MAQRVRHQSVVVGVVTDSSRFLLRYNPAWQKYAFVMKKTDPAIDPQEVALIALGDDLSLKFPDGTTRPLDRMGAWGESGRTGEFTYYDYQIYRIDRGDARAGAPREGEAKWFSYEQLQLSPDVSWSTRQIAKGLVEEREIVAAVVARAGAGGVECLLVDHPGYGHFPPAIVRSVTKSPESLATLGLELDAGYTGEVSADWIGEQEFLQSSRRFGSHEVRFRCHVCRATVPGVDLHSPENLLEQSLQQKGQQLAALGQLAEPTDYYRWISVDQLDTAPEISSSMHAIRLLVHQAAQVVP